MATKPSSFYQVCQAYNGKSSSLSVKQKKNFGMSISNTGSTIRRAFEMDSFFPVQEYLDLEKKSNLAAGFLQGFIGHATGFKQFFKEVKWGQYKFAIPTPNQKYQKVGVVGPYFYQLAEKKLIIPAYGNIDDPIGDFSIFKELCDRFLREPLYQKPGHYEFWSLTTGQAISVPVDELKEVNKSKLQSAINLIANQ